MTQKHQDDPSGWNYPDPKFAYSDDEWSKIAAVLPENVDLDEMRWQLEILCIGHLMQRHIQDWNKGIDKQLNEFAKKAYELLEIWPSHLKIRFDVLRDGHPEYVEPHYVSFQGIAKWIKDRATPEHPPKRGPRPFARDSFMQNLIFLWAQIGGSLGTSTSPIDGKAHGRIISFLIAAGNPVLDKKITPDAARTLVRKYRKYNKPPYDRVSRGWW